MNDNIIHQKFKSTLRTLLYKAAYNTTTQSITEINKKEETHHRVLYHRPSHRVPHNYYPFVVPAELASLTLSYSPTAAVTITAMMMVLILRICYYCAVGERIGWMVPLWLVIGEWMVSPSLFNVMYSSPSTRSIYVASVGLCLVWFWMATAGYIVTTSCQRFIVPICTLMLLQSPLTALYLCMLAASGRSWMTWGRVWEKLNGCDVPSLPRVTERSEYSGLSKDVSVCMSSWVFCLFHANF